jgi:hypothetical protein
VAVTAAELPVGGKGGRGTTTGEGEEASKDGSFVDVDGNGSRVEGDGW